MIRLYLLLGGNLGDKKKVFEETISRIARRVGTIAAKSIVYETEPWGFESKDMFWNQVIEVLTELSPEQVLLQAQQIEQEMGRIRKANQYDSRVIDIDILFYGDRVIDQENLTVPHPRIQERKFALIPLNEIAPGLIHPVFHKSIAQLLLECQDNLDVRIAPDA